ncbi:MAG: N-acetylmuramoyl-L-alanine amidase [Rhodothalassiaceae bacterium]
MIRLDRVSPNHGARRDGPVDILLLHYTATADAETAIDWLCDPQRQVSAHYVIDVDGTVYRLVEEAWRAWHAGVSFWGGCRDINSRSIGVEIVNAGEGCPPYPATQIDAVIALSRDIQKRHGIPPQRVLGHSDVAPRRKQDPGEHFPWQRLARAGVGLWPDAPGPNPTTDTHAVQAMLSDYGYEIRVDGLAGPETQAVVTAFQRHFRPSAVTGQIDAETVARLTSLLASTRSLG